MREENPLLTPLIHTQRQFNRMRARHELWMKKYPNKPMARGIPFTGLYNTRLETKAIAERMKAMQDRLPFDVMEYIDFEVPSDSDPDWGN